MMVERINELDALGLEYEHDPPYYAFDFSDEDIAQSASIRLVIQGASSPGEIECFRYLNIDDAYEGDLSKGQQELYELLLDLQDSTVYAITSVGRLAHALSLKFPMAIEKRLENLETLGAISGMRRIISS